MKTRRERALRLPTPSDRGRMRLAAVLFAGLILAQAPVALAQAPDWLWAERAGGSGIDFGNAIAMDESGNALVAGSFRGTAEFGDVTLTSAGRSDVFLAKYDAGGNVLWAQRAGGASGDGADAIAVDGAGNALVTGGFQGTAEFGDITLTSAGDADTFVAKYDAGGDVVWAKRAGGFAGDDTGLAVAVDGSGNALVTGEFRVSAEFGDTTLTNAGGDDAFVAKYDAGGDVVWAKRAGGSSEGITFTDRGAGIAVDGADNVFVTGQFEGTGKFGTATLTSAGAEDVFVAKYDPQGNVVWAQRAGGSSGDGGVAIAADGSGNALVTGNFNGTADFGEATLASAGDSDVFVAKYDAGGNAVWAQRAGGSDVDVGVAITVDRSGNALVAGRLRGTAEFGDTTLTSAGSTDAFVANVDTEGNVAWAQRAGGASSDVGEAIAVDGSGNALVTGAFAGTADFGDLTLASAGGSTDAFAAKLGSNRESEAASRGDNRMPPFNDGGDVGDPPMPDRRAGEPTSDGTAGVVAATPGLRLAEPWDAAVEVERRGPTLRHYDTYSR